MVATWLSIIMDLWDPRPFQCKHSLHSPTLPFPKLRSTCVTIIKTWPSTQYHLNTWMRLTLLPLITPSTIWTAKPLKESQTMSIPECTSTTSLNKERLDPCLFWILFQKNWTCMLMEEMELCRWSLTELKLTSNTSIWLSGLGLILLIFWEMKFTPDRS
jgi:hypothetical protein